MVDLPPWLKRWSLAVTGVVLATVPVMRLGVVRSPATAVLEAGVPLLLFGGVVYAGWIYARREPPRFTAIVTAWTLSVVAGMIVVALWITTIARLVGSASPFAALAPIVTSVGALAGLWLGTSNARWRERDAELRRERQRIDFLNELLRHYVLNAAQLIVGRAELLTDRIDGDDAADIARTGRRMARHVQQMRALVTSDSARWPVDLTAAVETAHAAVETAHPAVADCSDVRVVVEVPDSCQVLADDALDVLIEALLFQAVERADGADMTIRLSATPTPDGVTLIVDDAGGPVVEDVDPAEIDTDHGVFEFQQYLVATLAERYGGEVSVTERDDGARTEVWLPSPEDAFGNP
ncbi:MAG: sensor histidine kinase [Haloplanus sp.]